MSNDRDAIKDWVKQVFRDASLNKKEVYFGLKREFVNYDEVYSSIILEIRKELAALDTPPPSFMIMRPSRQLSKMICDPPRWGLYILPRIWMEIFSPTFLRPWAVAWPLPVRSSRARTARMLL